MSTFRAPAPRDQLRAAYEGLPDADPKLPMTKAIRTLRAAIFDLRESSRPELSLGANELDIRWRLSAKGQAQPIPMDFQAAVDHLDTNGELAAAQTNRGIVYSLTPAGRLREEDSRVAAWRRLAAGVPSAARYAVAVLAGAVLTLAATQIWHHFFGLPTGH